MDKDQLEKRLQNIEESMKQTIANFNALEGAKQECLYWLNTLNHSDKELK